MKRLIVYAILLAAAWCASAAFAADVAWPSDFNEKLAGHVAAEMATNTTAGAASFSVDPCRCTVGASQAFPVLRIPASGFYMILR